MIRAELTADVTLTALRGSIVNVTESQFAALSGIAVLFKDKAEVIPEEKKVEEAVEPVEEKTVSKTKKTTKSKK